MRRAVSVLVLGGTIALGAASARAQDAAPAVEAPPAVEDTATVRVTVENVESSRGSVWVALCNVSLSVQGCPDQKAVPAVAGTVDVVFEGIPPGVYAVAAFHDTNGNGVFDKFMGVPREPYALSGAAADELVPSFKDAAMEMKPGENDVTIRMKRLGG
jgi:uncharacterized protein (DUF2141 family)